MRVKINAGSAAGSVLTGVFLSFALFFTGCEEYEALKPEDEPRPVVSARYTDVPVVIDGVLDDAAWEDAEVYHLVLGADREGEIREKGKAMVSWDENYLYVGVKFYDSDIVAEGEEDQLHHYKKGDLLEVFLKPEGQTWYWELYATPAEYKSTFFIPGRGRIWLDSMADYDMDLKVGAKYEGTLNYWEDVDEYWTAEMAVPVEELTARGEEFGPGAEWKILIARYNFSRYLPNRELSMYPRLSRTSFHLHEEYASLELVK